MRSALASRSLHLDRTRAWMLKERDWSPLQRELLAASFAQLDSQDQRRKGLTRLIAAQVSAEPLMLRAMKLLGDRNDQRLRTALGHWGSAAL